MRKTLIVTTLLVISTSLAATATAGTIDLTLTGVGPNGALGPAYVGPYQATSGGSTIDIICDDFIHDSYLNESWTANVYTLTPADMSHTFFNDLTKYEEAAYLAAKLMSPTTTSKGDIQYAIWQLFDSVGPNQPFSYLTGSHFTNAQAWLAEAQNPSLVSTFTPSMFAGFVIYTPTSAAPTCSGHACPTAPPQEFITYVPEPGTLELLGLGLGAALFLRRRESASV